MQSKQIRVNASMMTIAEFSHLIFFWNICQCCGTRPTDRTTSSQIIQIHSYRIEILSLRVQKEKQPYLEQRFFINNTMHCATDLIHSFMALNFSSRFFFLFFSLVVPYHHTIWLFRCHFLHFCSWNLLPGNKFKQTHSEQDDLFAGETEHKNEATNSMFMMFKKCSIKMYSDCGVLVKCGWNFKRQHRSWWRARASSLTPLLPSSIKRGASTCRFIIYGRSIAGHSSLNSMNERAKNERKKNYFGFCKPFYFFAPSRSAFPFDSIPFLLVVWQVYEFKFSFIQANPSACAISLWFS